MATTLGAHRHALDPTASRRWSSSAWAVEPCTFSASAKQQEPLVAGEQGSLGRRVKVSQGHHLPNCLAPCRVKFSAACGPPVSPECEHCGQRHQVGLSQRREGVQQSQRPLPAPAHCSLCVRSLVVPCGQSPSTTWILWAASWRL